LRHVYAGGDVATGAATVILAMGAVKKAAHVPLIGCSRKNAHHLIVKNRYLNSPPILNSKEGTNWYT
jgi:hypothetical protein